MNCWPTNSDKLLEEVYSAGEFDHDLQAELLATIASKNPNMSLDDVLKLSEKITRTIGFLCAAFETGFIREVSADVGDCWYSVYVYLSKDNTVEI